MKYLIPIVVYPSFFGMVGFCVYYLNSGWPLLALIATPSWGRKNDTSKKS